MYKKILAASVFALSCSLVQPSAFACHAHHHINVEKLAKKLALTDEQQTKIKTIVVQSHENLVKSQNALRAIIIETDKEFVADAMNDKKINDFVNQETPIMAEMAKIHLKERLEISKILTNDQKAKFVNMLIKKHEKNA